MSAACIRALGLLDTHLCEELPEPESASLRGHLAGCAACADELERRRRLRRELRSALDVADLRALETRILDGIAADRRRGRAAVLGAAAAAVLVALALLEPAPPPARRGSLLAEARDAHLMCAVRGRYPSPLRPELAPERLGRFASLWPAVEPELSKTTLLSAHVCPHGARSFGHVVLRRGVRLVSVLATDDDPEPLPRAALGLQPDGIRIAAAARGGYAAFVLSDLDDPEHSTMSSQILPHVLRALVARPGRR